MFHIVCSVEEYISMAKEKFQYTGEQALGLLYWHRYDIERATQDLGNFTPHPEEWTIEDKVLFEQAFQFHGKCFDKIRQMVSVSNFEFNLYLKASYISICWYRYGRE